MNKKVAKIEPKGWQKIAQAWQKMTSPSRPSLGDVQVYGKFIQQIIKGNRHYRVLVLGSTPELRNLILKLGLSKKIDLYLLDMNLAMIYAMNSFLEIDAAKERRIIGDWLKMPFKDQFFDIVLGDEILINVAEKNRDGLLQEIYRALRPGGAFIARASHINPLAKNFTVAKSLNKYSKLYLQHKLTLNQVLNYLFEEIFELSYFRNNEKYLYINALLGDIRHQMRSRDAVKAMIMRLFVNEYQALMHQRWSWESYGQQIKRFKKYFKIEKIETAKDYLYAYILPIYFLIKR
jgi:SAM-dependent methyltransferase